MMMNELSEILITAISAIGGTGGLAGILFYRHSKKMKALEAQLKSEEVSKARIESKADEWHIWKDQCEAMSDQNKVLIERNQQLVNMNAEKEDRHMQDLREKEERFNRQTDFLRGVQRDLIASLEREKEHIKKEGLLERRITYLLGWICKDGNCDHGVPPRERLKGKTFDSRERDIDNEFKTERHEKDKDTD